MEEEYLRLDGNLGSSVKDLGLGSFENTPSDSHTSEGMEKALTLLQYVQESKRILDGKEGEGIGDIIHQQFMKWFEVKVQRFHLEKELELLKKLK